MSHLLPKVQTLLRTRWTNWKSQRSQRTRAKQCLLNVTGLLYLLNSLEWGLPAQDPHKNQSVSISWRWKHFRLRKYGQLIAPGAGKLSFLWGFGFFIINNVWFYIQKNSDSANWRRWVVKMKKRTQSWEDEVKKTLKNALYEILKVLIIF